MNYYRVLFSFFVLISCSHDPDQVKEIDTRLISAGSVGKNEIGVDKNNRMLVQTQKELDNELRSAIWLNSQTLFELKYLLSRLSSCFIEKKESLTSSDFPVLDLSVIEEIENKEEKEELGLNSKGEYKLITKEGYTAKLKAERVLKKKLVSLKRKVKNQLLRCEYLNN